LTGKLFRRLDFVRQSFSGGNWHLDIEVLLQTLVLLLSDKKNDSKYFRRAVVLTMKNLTYFGGDKGLLLTKTIYNWGSCADCKVFSPQQRRCGSTGKQPEIPTVYSSVR
jgi:hypothetical protein